VPIGNLLTRLVGSLVALALLEPAARLIPALDPSPARAIADFHTLFNLAVAAVFLPLLTPLAALIERWLPEKQAAADPGQPRYLDSTLGNPPTLAIGAAAREALRLADVIETMLAAARDAFEKGDRKRIDEVKALDDTLDRLNAAIKANLTALGTRELDPEDRRRLEETLLFATNMEQAGDAIENSLIPLAAKRLKRGLAYSPEGQKELSAMLERVIANARKAASLFTTGDIRGARLLAAEKAVFRDLEAEATGSHFARLRAGRIDTAENSALHLDVIRDLKRINSHLIAGAAYPVLERGGELLATRLASNDR
jgi:phosphate:Na+ symporter